MANVKSVNLKIKPSASPDVVEYKFYYEPAADPSNLGPNSPSVSLGMPPVDPDTKRMGIDAAALKDANGDPLFTDGRYDIGATAVDDAGNESDMGKKFDVPFDFVAPDAPEITEVTRK